MTKFGVVHSAPPSTEEGGIERFMIKCLAIAPFVFLVLFLAVASKNSDNSATTCAILFMASIVAMFIGFTGIGARRRGNRIPICLLQAVLFPVTWVVWFTSDNKRAGRSAFQGH